MQELKIGDLTLKNPILQGGMGIGVSMSGLASAVANEGGVGIISSAGLGLLKPARGLTYTEANIQALADEIQKARKKTNGLIGINIMVAMTNYGDMVKTSISEKVDFIFSGAGLPMDLPSYLNGSRKTKLVPIVSSARAAKIICEKWKNQYDYLPDAIVVEGPKAGGHLGFKLNQLTDDNYSLEHLIPEVVEVVKVFEDKYNVKIPVIAAGGIYTGQNIRDIMRLGASGVQLGTRFVTTTECDASDAFKQLYISSKEEDVSIILSPVGMPGRAINNSFIEKVNLGEKHPLNCPFKCIRTCNTETSPYCIIKALISAYKGNFKTGYAFAGSNAYLTKKIISVKETFNDIMREYSLSI